MTHFRHPHAVTFEEMQPSMKEFAWAKYVQIILSTIYWHDLFIYF